MRAGSRRTAWKAGTYTEAREKRENVTAYSNDPISVVLDQLETEDRVSTRAPHAAALTCKEKKVERGGGTRVGSRAVARTATSTSPPPAHPSFLP